MKALNLLCFAACMTASSVLAEGSQVDHFVARVMECSGGSILQTSSTELADALQAYLGDENLAGGSTTVSLSNFMSFFPEGDRLEAFRIYTTCLVNRFDRVEGTDTLIITELDGGQVFSLPSSSVLLLSEFLDRSEGQRSFFTLSFDRRCQMSVYATDNNRHRIEFAVERQATGGLVGSASSDWGNENRRGRIDEMVPPGEYELIVAIAANNRVDAGYYELAVDTRSCM